eukprot:TsM_000996900 transcript=TsM_000996900 gene=TsM_000996900
MMRIITILAFVTYCSGANPPKLWGSRVVSKKSGPSDSMYYKFDGEYNAYINHGSQTSRLSIIDGKCLIDETRVWGSPCREGARDATITLADVTAQDNLIITEKRPHPRISSTTFFVPQCKFRRPGPDEVDLETSFPLSRFVKDMEVFTVDFAVQGAESKSRVNQFFNLVKYKEADLRIFRGVFTRKPGATHESFTFSGNRTLVVVSVDYSQSDEIFAVLIMVLLKSN